MSLPFTVSFIYYNPIKEVFHKSLTTFYVSLYICMFMYIYICVYV